MHGDARNLLQRYLLPQRGGVLALVLLLLAAVAVSVAHPRLLATFIDGAAGGEPADVLTRVGVAFIVLAVVSQVVNILDELVAAHVALVATNRLRADLTRQCLGLDLSFHTARQPGELIERIDGDSAHLANFLSRFLVALVGNGLLLFAVTGILGAVDWRLGTIVFVSSVAVVALAVRYQRFGRPYWERFMQAQADQAGFLEEHLAGTEDLRAAGAAPYAMRRHAEQSRDLLHAVRRSSLLGNLVGTAAAGAFRLTSFGALGCAVWLYTRDQLSLGEVFLVFAYTQLLADPIQAITREIADLQTAVAAMHRVNELLETRSQLVETARKELPTGALSVELAGVTFRYGSDEDEVILDEVSFAVGAGDVLGIVGRTGSGKTTIAKLLLRFYDPKSGHVRLNGTDLRDVTLESVRTQVGIVTQDVHLFHASVRDNLTLFDSAIPIDRIVAVLASLGLDGWLAGLPDGLDTLLAGDTGLSAGESQLLAFARVFLRDPGLVILDEATARLDPATEHRVERAVSDLFAGRTAIVIAHRLSTVMRADHILVLDDGRVVEHGERAQLMADPESRFARLLAVGLEETRT